MQGVFAAILQVLAPFPEARAAVAQARSLSIPKGRPWRVPEPRASLA